MKLINFTKKKVVAIGLAGGLAAGAGGIAAAYYLSTGTGTGTAHTATAPKWVVTNVGVLTGQPTLAPGVNNVTLKGTVQNPGPGNLGLHQLVVTITGTNHVGCTAGNFKLGDPGTPWVVTPTGLTATRTLATPLVIPSGHYYTGNTSTPHPTGQAVTPAPTGAGALYHLKISMPTTGLTPSACANANVNLKVTAS